ncbi:DUF2244 domain-containing protein [Phenylobacterium kunshanense]|uniref:DUF2244 domain-containing protein n=1 Tax=Phenylobacterium kunshanense TaxID=1445034 RepID=UPI001403820E|nr:DUF2244 domain-containing protein [Phenylobacterium kunshanense]
MSASSATVDLAPGRRSVRPMPAAPLFMDAEIRPNRSLSRRGFMILIAVVTAANVAAALVFLSQGAFLVPIFMGIDVLAVVVAFMANYRSGQMVERVQVSPSHVKVTHEAGGAVRLVWESPTAFTRITREHDEEDRVMALGLALSGRGTPVAASLSPGERREFGRALEEAIWRARRHRD